MPFTEKDIQYLKALAQRKGYKVKLINNTEKPNNETGNTRDNTKQEQLLSDNNIERTRITGKDSSHEEI